jgi:plasmid stabilization system protein ParE
MAQVIWTPKALDDLESLLAYIVAIHHAARLLATQGLE